MTLTLTNLSTGDTLTLRGVRPTSDDLAALITLEGIGLIAKFESDGRYGLTSGKRINPLVDSYAPISVDEGPRPPLTPFGEQLVKIARGE